MDFIDLGGKWEVSQTGKKEKIPASVPGCIHTDLLAAGKIEEPFYRDNEASLQWIGETGWIYKREFNVDAQTLGRDRLLLRCEGLDTFATVSVNGRKVASTDSMFRTWEWDVKKLLKTGRNLIEVKFDSVMPDIRKKQKAQAIFGVQSVPYEPHGRGYVRKEQCNFGWDWGPVFITCGIWRKIGIVAFDTARLEDVRIRQKHGKNRVDLSVSFDAEKVSRAALTASVSVSLDGNVVVEKDCSVKGGRSEVKLAVSNPKLWWPNGMGKQHLYEVTVELLDADGNLLDTSTRRIGLRTLELITKKDKWGQSFHFEANGVPFFAKGSNWIPTDSFVTRIPDSQYRYLLASAAEANMNMIRVWGGGIYEDDRFYDLCDELGLTVWQDMMFACSAYPAWDKHFMENVKCEIEDNAARLRHHPSLALWCGNNELEQFVISDEIPGKMKWKDYKLLFDKLIPETLGKIAPDTRYWPCSPHSPVGDRNDDANPDCGDAHLWSVWFGRQPFEWYRTAFHRFCSEFGFQSFPEPKTVNGYTAKGDRNVTSPVMEHHQRSGIGNAAIIQYMLSWFRMPDGFDNTLWLSQIQHGLAMKYAVEHWRRNMPRCMGALYWQINDCWPVASWASIDYHGRWKALHYMAKRFFAPVLLSGVEDLRKKTVDIHLTSDRREKFSAKILWKATTAGGNEIASGSKTVTAKPLGCAKMMTINLAKEVEKYGEDIMVWLTLEEGKKVIATDFVTLVRPKRLNLSDPELAATVSQNKDGSFAVKVKTAKPALWAWLELSKNDAKFSDNFFCLEPGKETEITVIPFKPMSKSEFEKQLKVSSIFNTYKS